MASAQEVLEAAPASGVPASGASVHSSPSLLGPAAAVQQHQLGCTATQQPQQDQQQQQQQQHNQQQAECINPQQQEVMPPSIAAQASSMQRLGGALQGVLSSGLSSDFVEGLKPVMLGGSLQISTHILLAGEAEPVFIGMFPTLQAAVDAQKQSQALVSHAACKKSRGCSAKGTYEQLVAVVLDVWHAVCAQGCSFLGMMQPAADACYAAVVLACNYICM
jgi:hypothetical protein